MSIAQDPSHKPGKRAIDNDVRQRSAFGNSLPAEYLRTMLDLAAERGIEPSQALAGSPLTLRMLENPDLRVTARDASHVLRRAVELSGDHGFGIEFGLRTSPIAHGYLGYAVMSVRTLREAIELIIRYLHLRQRDIVLSLAVDRDDAVLEARDTHQLGPWRQLIHESIMVGLYRIAGFLVGEAADQWCELCFDWPEPAYFARFKARIPRARFAMPAVQIRFPLVYLDRSLVTADRSAARRAMEQIEHEAVVASAPSLTLLERVRGRIKLGEHGGYPALAQVASQLHWSTRTLKRRLSDLGSGFQELLDEARQRDAMRMLADPDIDIQQIATTLGYKDPPSFTRAFRRWSGTTPRAARYKLLGSPE